MSHRSCRAIPRGRDFLNESLGPAPRHWDRSRRVPRRHPSPRSASPPIDFRLIELAFALARRLTARGCGTTCAARARANGKQTSASSDDGLAAPAPRAPSSPASWPYDDRTHYRAHGRGPPCISSRRRGFLRSPIRLSSKRGPRSVTIYSLRSTPARFHYGRPITFAASTLRRSEAVRPPPRPRPRAHYRAAARSSQLSPLKLWASVHT